MLVEALEPQFVVVAQNEVDGQSSPVTLGPAPLLKFFGLPPTKVLVHAVAGPVGFEEVTTVPTSEPATQRDALGQEIS